MCCLRPPLPQENRSRIFPVLTLLSKDAPRSIGAVYIGPLKALINDQFSRLEELCGEAGIPVWHWHGDVAQSHKARMLKHPSGVLQITPESLEAMLMRKHADIPRLFGDLRFIVIDEVHSVMRGDRGGQTLCLIERLCSLAGVNPRRIGLSATIGEPEEMGRLLSQGTGRRTVIPRLENKGVRWRLSMEHFFTTGPQAAEPEKKNSAQNTLEAAQTGRLCADSQRLHISTEESSPLPAGITAAQGERLEAEFTADRTDTAPVGADPGIGYIFEHTRGRKCLVFVNSREECETVTTTLRQYCEYKHEADRFLIHHGNLSASYRETAEEAMKDETRALTTVTTATLELGIDIGRLERAFQINAPFTVSSFLQRMGRTGRRELPPEMRFVMRGGAAGDAGIAACVPAVAAASGRGACAALQGRTLGGAAKAWQAAVQPAVSPNHERALLLRRAAAVAACPPRAFPQLLFRHNKRGLCHFAAPFACHRSNTENGGGRADNRHIRRKTG